MTCFIFSFYRCEFTYEKVNHSKFTTALHCFRDSFPQERILNYPNTFHHPMKFKGFFCHTCSRLALYIPPRCVLLTLPMFIENSNCLKLCLHTCFFIFQLKTTAFVFPYVCTFSLFNLRQPSFVFPYACTLCMA